jgi:hypothetical protein
MAFEKTILFAVICDGCGPDWWEGTTDTLPLFISHTLAIQELTADYEWRVTRQVDGRHHMLCSTCVGKQDCTTYGHRWYRASADDDRRLDPAVEMCHRCNIIRREDAPPAGHPDAVPVALTDEQSAVLAELDAQTFPKESTR